MPANLIRESGGSIGDAFHNFSESAQRIGVYTSMDYVDILKKLITRWEIDKINNLTDEAEKARDYLMKLPDRMAKLADRIKVSPESHVFKWVNPALVK